MTRVRCTVDSCDYWGEGQRCTAEEIWVKVNATRVGSAFNEFAEELGKARGEVGPLGDMTASSSGETCCDTMRPRRHERTQGGERHGNDCGCARCRPS
ncbi:MAG TPA: DUF1540 domain-containing protein [Firmicutes bacterium]|nr:DUF1540 domain-containing protein [Bacillota bacterium]